MLIKNPKNLSGRIPSVPNDACVCVWGGGGGWGGGGSGSVVWFPVPWQLD